MEFSVDDILFPDGAMEKLMRARQQYLDKVTAPIVQGQGKDKRWHTRVKDPTTKTGYRLIAGKTREDVERKVIQFFMDTENAQPLSPTVSECWHDWYAFRKEHNHELKRRSFSVYMSCWNRYFAGTAFAARRVRDITDTDIEKFMVDVIEKRHLVHTQATEFAFHMRQIFWWAYKQHVIDRNPWEYVDVKDVVFPACTAVPVRHDADMILSPAQVEQFTTAVEKHLTKHPDYLPDLMILVSKYTGMRTGEIVALQWADIQDGYIQLRHSERRYTDTPGHQTYEVGDTKTHRERRVVVVPELDAIFNRIRAIQRRNGWYSMYVGYWENAKGVLGRMTANCLGKAIAQRGTEANIDGGVTVYRFRRTVESGLRERGLSGETVGHILGHSRKVGDEHYAYDMTSDKTVLAAMQGMYASPQ